jgi:hypothetical protein
MCTMTQGVVVDPPRLGIVMELCKNGDLFETLYTVGHLFIYSVRK